jgi:hypothetical protein
MEKKLRVKLSTFQTPLTFNEWAEEYKVSSMHTEQTPYYQGNLTTQDPQLKSSLYQSIEEMFPRISVLEFIKQKFKKKKQWQEKTN